MGDAQRASKSCRNVPAMPRIRIQVVGRFVEKQHVGFSSNRHSATRRRSQREGRDFRVPVGQTQRIGGAFQLAVKVVAVMRLKNLFQTGPVRRPVVSKSASGSATGYRPHRDVFNAPTTSETASYHGLTHGVFHVQLRFPAAEADLRSGCGRRFTSMSVSIPAMMRSSVDLPEPFRPRTRFWRQGRNSGRCS